MRIQFVGQGLIEQGAAVIRLDLQRLVDILHALIELTGQAEGDHSSSFQYKYAFFLFLPTTTVLISTARLSASHPA